MLNPQQLKDSRHGVCVTAIELLHHSLWLMNSAEGQSIEVVSHLHVVVPNVQSSKKQTAAFDWIRYPNSPIISMSCIQTLYYVLTLCHAYV